MEIKDRKKARRLALQVLYMFDLMNYDSKFYPEDLFRKSKLNQKTIDYAKFLIYGTLKNKEYYDNIIKKYLKNYRIERLSYIERNILRMALFEILEGKDVPDKVVLDEAIELTKYFSTISSSKFVNGVLDEIYRNFILKEKNNNQPKNNQGEDL